MLLYHFKSAKSRVNLTNATFLYYNFFAINIAKGFELVKLFVHSYYNTYFHNYSTFSFLLNSTPSNTASRSMPYAM